MNSHISQMRRATSKWLTVHVRARYMWLKAADADYTRPDTIAFVSR